MNNKINLKAGIVILMVIAAAMSRLLPHPPNFTSIGAMSLFGAAYFGRRWLAVVIPFLALWISDLLLNNLIYARAYPEFYDGFTWFGNPYVYVSFLLIVGLGWVLLRTVSPLRLLGASVAASLLFFLVTNFGVMLTLPTYPNTPAGLLMSYTAGLPFFWNTLLGDLFFTALLFGLYEFAVKRNPAVQAA